jgi:hypothetical protein
MFTEHELANILKLIERALTSAPQPGGIADHFATAQLMQKIQAERKALRDGKDLPTGNQ